MGKSYLYSIRVCLIFYILLLALSFAIPMSENTTGEVDTISIPKELYVILTDLLRKEVTEHQEETQAERLASLESKLTIYEVERKQILKYFDLLTETIKRIMQMEKETDMLKTSLREMNDKIQAVTNDLSNIEYDMGEIQRDIIPEMKKETQNVEENIQYVNNSLQRIEEITHWCQENFTMEINHIKSYTEDKSESIKRQQERDNTTVTKMFTDINWEIQNYSTSMEQIKHDIQQAFEDEGQQDAEIKNNCSVAIATREINFNKKLAKLNQEMAAVNQNSNDTNQRVTTLHSDLVLLTSKVQRSNKAVTFTARLEVSSQFALNAVIRFNYTITNVGNGYNASDGIFYCPVDEVYVFDVSLMGNSIYTVDGNLYKNSDIIGYIWEDMYKVNRYPNAAATFTLSLKAGDKISVTCPRSYNKYFAFSYFTGFLIPFD